MKLKTTNKQIRDRFDKVISIGYCDAQYLLEYKKPFAYTSGIYGWNAYFYEVDNVCISTGYRSIGYKVDYTLLRELEKQAQKICLDYELNRETKEKQLNVLIKTLINSVK